MTSDTLDTGGLAPSPLPHAPHAPQPLQALQTLPAQRTAWRVVYGLVGGIVGGAVGSALVTVVPDGGNMEIWFYAPSQAIGFTKPGQRQQFVQRWQA